MSRRYHVTSVDEYKFLKNKCTKILTKAKDSGPLRFNRARKQIRKFLKRLFEIEAYHKNMGWPHPEYFLRTTEDIRKEFDLKTRDTNKQPMVNPDGTLYQKGLSTEHSVQTKKFSPDGTLFETPVMDGAVMQFHSEDKIKKYLEEKQDNEED